MENEKNIASEYYGLKNLLAFCDSQKCNEDQIVCYLECYRTDLENKRKYTIEDLRYMVDKYLYPMRKDYKENGPMFESYPGELPDESDEPEEFESKEELIADIEKLEKELGINTENEY